MRHKKKRSMVLNTGVQKRSNVMRNMITSLVLNGHVVTSYRRAKALKASTDSFFSRLVRIHKKSDTPQDAQREVVRYVKSILYTEKAGKIVTSDLLPRYLNDGVASFVSDYKLGFRKGDAAESILVKLV